MKIILVVGSFALLIAILAVSYPKAYDASLVEVAWQEAGTQSMDRATALLMLQREFRKIDGEHVYHFSYYGAMAVSGHPDVFLKRYRNDTDSRDIIDFSIVNGPKFSLNASGFEFDACRVVILRRLSASYGALYPTDLQGFQRLNLAVLAVLDSEGKE